LGEKEKFVVMYSIQTVQTNAILNTYSSFSKQTTNEVNSLLSEFNISALPSGKYKLQIDVKDKENKIVAQQSLLFQRQNKQQSESFSFNDLKSVDVNNTFVTMYNNPDTLASYIKSLRPISSTAEIQYSENQVKAKKLLEMQQYFYNFWRSRNSLQPEQAWKDYHIEVLKVNREYATFGLKGYDTDKGRVYLQYGAPNVMSKYDAEPSAYPYEIWQYDVLVDKTIIVDYPNNKQTNRRFVFYNPDLVTNKYVLIHSDAKGEVYNTRWELLIHNRDSQSNNLDDEKAPTHYGGNADDNFNHPR
jgi:GWxTD domain-containing protein